MNVFKIMFTTLAVLLCIVGTVLVLFELAMLGSEPGALVKGGWIIFLMFTLIGMALFAGGVWLLFRTHGKH